jgi:PAS domain S-box-containing protein
MTTTNDILVIEDDEIMREALAEWLEAAGYVVRKAADGSAGLAAVRSAAPALVVTDIHMPGTSGADVIAELQRHHPDIPVIAISGLFQFGRGLDADSAVALGAARALAKPFTRRELLQAVTVADLDARKRAEYLTRQVFESASDGVAVIGRDYRYQRVNPVYERNWGMPAERIVGMHVAELAGSDVFERTLKPHLDRCLAGEHVTFAEWFTTELGRFYLSVSYSPLRLDSERLEAVLVISRDLTEHVLASEALREAQAALARVNRVTTLGVLAASIAHEVNQPLTAMVASAGSCARWLAAEPLELEKAQRSLERIARDGKRAREVIDRIRALVMRQPPRRDRVDVKQTIIDVIALTRDQMRRNNIALKTELADGLPSVRGDRVQLQQVILNLIANAIDAMSAPSDRPRQLVIGCAGEAACGVRIEVRDSGPGIAPEMADKLFEPFCTSKPQGIGMGLSICQSIVEAHGGRLWAASNLPHGALFQLSLPAGEREP